MERGTNSLSDDNIPRGCLKLNNKIYPVFDGVNTVGRNPEAVINIKNLNVSTQHAIITVVDENGHYISDIKSSNGTVLDNEKLKPLKLYKLNNGASIKFADVFCTYKRLDCNELVSDTLEESQNFNESLYLANTQTVHLQNSDETIFNEMLTQVVEPREVSFNEMPTQVVPHMSSINNMPNQIVPHNVSINDMQTQVMDFNNLSTDKLDDDQDASSSDSLDFMTMQKATQSQSFAFNGHSDSDTEESVKLKSGTSKLNSDSEDVHSTPEILPVKLNPKQNILRSDSEGVSSTPESNNTVTDPEQESLSPICPVKKSKKTTIQSDSESDTEEYNIQEVHPERRRSKYILSDDDETDIEDDGKVQTTLNETDIIPGTQKSECSINHELEQSSMGSLRLELTERIDENEEEMKEGNVSAQQKISIAQDHIYCQDSNSENLDTTGADGDHIYCRSETRENQDESISEDKRVTEASNIQPTEKHIEQGEDLNAQKTPGEETKETEEAAINEEKTDANDIPDQPAEQQNVVDDETQSIIGDLDDNQEDVEKLLSDKEQKAENEIGDILDQSTPQLEDTRSIIRDEDQNSERTEGLKKPSNQIFEEKEKLQEDEKKSETTLETNQANIQSGFGNTDQNSECTEDLMGSSSHNLEEKLKEDEKKIETAMSINQEDTATVDDKDQKTELAEELMGSSDHNVEEKLKEDEKKSESNQSTEEILPADYPMNEEDIFAQPTQQMEFNFVEDKNKSKADDDIYLQSTQQITNPEDSQNKYKTDDDDDDIYIQATQKINDGIRQTSKSVESRKSDDFYLLPTQELIEKQSKDVEPSVEKEHEFARPYEVFNTEKKTKVLDDDDENEDESLFLPPTQAMEFLHKEDEASTSNKPNDLSDQNSNEVENQLEQLFYSQSDHMFVATQQLVDVLEEKNDEDIIDKSILEENDFANSKYNLKTRNSKDSKFESVDSIRMLLDDDLTKASPSSSETTKEDEGQVKENKEAVKKQVKTYQRGRNKTKGKVNENSEETTSEKNNETEAKAIKEAINLENVINTPGGRRSKRNMKEKKEDVKENNVESIEEKTDENESKSIRNRTKTRKDHDKDGETSEDKSTDKTDELDVSAEVKESSKKTRGKKKNVETDDAAMKLSSRHKQKEDSFGKDSDTMRDRKCIDKERETSEDKYNDKTDESNVNAAVKENNKRTRGEKKNVEINDDLKKPTTRRKQKEDSLERDSDTTKGIECHDKENDKNDESNDKATVKDSSKRTRGEKRNAETDDDVKKPSTRQKQKESEKDSDICQKKEVKKVTVENDDGKKPNTRGKHKEDSSEKEDKKTSKDLVKEGPTTSISTRKRVLQNNTSDNDPNSEDQEVKTKTRRKNPVIKDTNDNLSESCVTSSKQTGKKKLEITKEHDSGGDKEEPSTSTRTMTRKRNLKVTDVDSGDEFEPKVENVESPKKATIIKPPETPTTRKSARSKKLKMAEDEVISISSSSATDVISISSGDSDEPTKKSRRLSANSRAQLRAEEMIKEKDIKVKGRKASIQESVTPEEDKNKHKETRVRGRKVTGQETAVPATPERNKRQLKPKVVFTMMDNPELESLIRQLGGSVVDTVDACTVLVTGSVKRSQKLLRAVGQAKPICSPKWLLDCKKSYSFLDPWDYILVDKEAETKWQFSLRESLNRSNKTKLLENYTFQLIVNNAADVLKGAIEACGGKCVTRNLVKADTNNKVIVSTADNKKKWGNIVKLNPEIKVVEPEAIFDGTLRQEFRFDQYLLT